MSIIETLKLSNVQRQIHQSPVIRRRNKLVERLHDQLMLAKAIDAGSKYEIPVFRKKKDAETGQPQKVEGLKQVKKWWFVTDEGKVVMQVRYGSKVLELSKGKTSIEIDAMDKLIPTVELVKKAVLNGELDRQISAACEKR